LIIYSEDFSTWTLRDAGDVVVDDVAICPDGRTVAASIAGDSTDGEHGISRAATLTAATYTFSCYVKPGNKNWVYLRDATLAVGCYFDVTNGTVGSAVSSATGYMEGPFYSGDATPFYRCAIIFTGTAALHHLYVRVAEADNDYEFAGDGSTPNLYVWGAQCELGDYMTSPVRTSGSALTRLADNLQFVAGENIGGEDVGQGTIRLDILHPACQIEAVTASLRYPFSINDGGAAADRVFGYVANDEKWYAESRATAGNSGAATTVGICADNTKHTVGVTWNSNNLVAYRDGVTLLPDTACDMPDDLDTIMFSAFDAGRQFKGLIQNFRIYNIPTTKG